MVIVSIDVVDEFGVCWGGFVYDGDSLVNEGKSIVVFGCYIFLCELYYVNIDWEDDGFLGEFEEFDEE